jgi:hypothetical protein
LTRSVESACHLFLPVVKQMEQMSISFKGVLCSSVFILGG